MSESSSTTLVVGLGTLHGGDDRVGLDVAALIADLGLDGVEVVEQADPTNLVAMWEGRDHVVVADALLAGAEPGTVLVVEAGADAPPLDGARMWTASGGSHAFGLADAVALSRTLGVLPRRVTVVGVVAGSFRAMAPVSEAVRAAVPVAVDRVLAAMGTTTKNPEVSHHVSG